MNQGYVQVSPSQLIWQVSIGDDKKSHVSSGKLPSHLKPESIAVTSGKETILNKIDVLAVSINDVIESTSEEDFIPSRFNHMMEDEYKKKLQNDYLFITEKLKSDPRNGSLRVKVAQTALLISEMYAYYLAQIQAKEEINQENEELCFNKQNTFLTQAKRESQRAKDLNSLDPLAYYTESLIMEFQGVNCREIDKVEEYLKLLKLALALDPTKEDIEETWNEAISFLEQRWSELKNNEEISPETYSSWIEKLNVIISSNPLKDFFQNNPELFKLSKDGKHSAFFERNPELKSVEAFLSVYFQAGIIPLTTMSVEAIRSAVSKGENNPLATKLFFVHPKGNRVITTEEANEIKDSMVKYATKNKVLRVYLGNQEDMALIVKSFRLDKSLPRKFDTLTTETVELERFSIPIYALSISL